MIFNEAQLENAFIALLDTEGIKHLKGDEINRTNDEVLIREDLKNYLHSQYVALSDAEIESIVRKLEVLPSSDLYDSNKQFMDWISNGFTFKREDYTKKDVHIQLIDFSEKDNNTYRFVNQLPIVQHHPEGRIPDGIIYINGLPLVVFEFKTAIVENVTIQDAYTQITTRYRRDIPELFKYNAFCVISDGVNTKAGSFFAPFEFYYAWRSASDRQLFEEKKEANGIASLFTLVKGMLNPTNLRQIIHHFIYMPDTGNKDIKILCRYPQFYAANKLFENIKLHQKPHGDGKGGTYFGATGCGKSFTMLFLTRLLMRSTYFKSPTIILITDRTDLDSQLSEEFTNAKRYVGDATIVSVESRSHLRALLKGRQSGGVFLTTIHKFNEDIELLTDRTNVICISDEAHRSQVNLDQKVTKTETGIKKTYGFAKYLHDSLPNATYVGFTGTPIDSTLDVFGDIVDSYTMTESVKDEITVRIVYEGRAAKVVLDNSKLVEIEEYYENCVAEGASEYQVEDSKKETSNMNAILGDPDVLKTIAKDFIKHYSKRLEEGATVKGKAMFVCPSRPIAFELYKQMIAQLGERSSSSLNYATHFTNKFGLPEEWHTGNLPHRTKNGLVQFITFRLADSLPKSVLLEIEEKIKHLPIEAYKVEKRKLTEKYLNNGLGCCALKNPKMAQVMLEALQYHDKENYDLLAWSIMPNHVHVLIQATSNISKIIQSWKSFTGKWALKNNKKLGLNIPSKAAKFWMPEYWDRFIRDEQHFNNTIKYILSNPLKAGLGKNSVSNRYTSCIINDGMKQELQPTQIKMIMTRGKDDPKEMYDLLGNKEHRRALDRQFKNGKSNFKIAIVVDMWLTGFDVPFLDTIYIYKPLQKHNLIQTISRVNRKFKGKNKGLVVDYIGIKKAMNLALAMYNQADSQNFEDIAQSVIVVKDHLDVLRKIFHTFNNKDYFNGSPLGQLQCLNKSAEFVQSTLELEKRFMHLVKRLKAAYDICAGSEAFDGEQRDYIHYYLAVRSIVFKLTKGNAPDSSQMNAKVRALIKDALQSDGVEEIFKLGDENETQIDIFDEDYLAKINKIKLPNTKIKLLQQLLLKAISDLKKVNKMQGIDFTKKLQGLVEKYNKRKDADILVSEVYDDMAESLTHLVLQIKQAFVAGDELGIDFEEKAFYDILKQLAHKYDFDYPEDKLIILAKHVKKVVDDKAQYTDWSHRADIKAELKVDLIILLGENGYPPVDRDEVYREIFEQAENFKKHRTTY